MILLLILRFLLTILVTLILNYTPTMHTLQNACIIDSEYNSNRGFGLTLHENKGSVTIAKSIILNNMLIIILNNMLIILNIDVNKSK